MDALPDYTKRRPLPAYTEPERPAHERTPSGAAKRAVSWVGNGLGKLVGFYFRGGYPLHVPGTDPVEVRPKGHGVEVARARIREREEMDRAAALAAHERALRESELAGEAPPAPHAAP